MGALLLNISSKYNHVIMAIFTSSSNAYKDMIKVNDRQQYLLNEVVIIRIQEKTQ